MSRWPADSVVVYSSRSPGWEDFDRAAGFAVVRDRSAMLLPTPAVARRLAEVVRAEGCERVWFGAAMPLARLAGGLRRVGVRRVVASTHGHETGWARVPVARGLLRSATRGLDALTYITEFTRRGLAAALPDTARLVHLPPGVDTEAFHPDVDGTPVRRALDLGERPVVVCVSRLVPRKGQDVLIRSLPEIRAAVGDAVLLLVGGGPDRDRLGRLARAAGVDRHVVFAGEVPLAQLPAHFAAADVFAMPCRTRRAGLDVEGLGMVYLEASAAGLPVVAGTSGGAPEAVLPGRTGVVIGDPRSPGSVAAAIVPLLADADLRARWGRAGRAWVEQEWRWDILAARLQGLLDGELPGQRA